MSVKFQDYYEILGVARSATPEEIKQAFRALARLHHPDVAKDKASGEARFKEINEAYEVLGDLEKRSRYDELGESWKDDRPGGPPRSGPRARNYQPQEEGAFEFNGTGFSDFFESFFSGSHGGGGRKSAFAAGPTNNAGYFGQQGQDVEADLLVTLDEVMHGSQRRVTIKRPVGQAGTLRTDTYDVRVPAGIGEGKRIRLAGQSDPGNRDGDAGDIYLRVRLERHPDFTVQGSDLYCDLDIAPWEAVLGIQAKLPTLDGPTLLRVPPETTLGTQLRLRGMGLPLAEHQRGDLYATVRIKMPLKVTAQERVLWEQLASISTFKPRNKP